MVRRDAENHLNRAVNRIIRSMDDDEFAQVLESLSPDETAAVSQAVRVRPGADGDLTDKGPQIRRRIMFAAQRMMPLVFAEILDGRMSERTEEYLGDDYENPSLGQVEELTEMLTSEFGLARTRVWFALLVSRRVIATPHIESVAAGIPGLELRPDVATNQPDTHVPETDESRREARRVRRQEQREARSRQRHADRRSRENNRKFRGPASTDSPPPVQEKTGPVVDPVPVTVRVFPHLGRYPKADPRHKLVGGIIISWIRFTSEPDTGKLRPCVILAVEEKRMVVKPLYSHARYGAGFWRAVEIRRWEEAGLSHLSWAGDEVHTVRRRDDIVGRLHVSDWNQICLGESQPDR